MPAFGLGQTLFEMRYQRAMQEEAVARQERQRTEDRNAQQNDRMAQLAMQYGVQERLYDKQRADQEWKLRMEEYYKPKALERKNELYGVRQEDRQEFQAGESALNRGVRVSEGQLNRAATAANVQAGIAGADERARLNAERRRDLIAFAIKKRGEAKANDPAKLPSFTHLSGISKELSMTIGKKDQAARMHRVVALAGSGELPQINWDDAAQLAEFGNYKNHAEFEAELLQLLVRGGASTQQSEQSAEPGLIEDLTNFE